MSQNFATIQRAIAEDPALRGRVKLVSISFDPEHDTPAVLAAHAAKLKADPAVWTFLTGDRVTVEKFAARFGVGLIRPPESPTEFTHNLRTILDRRRRARRADLLGQRLDAGRRRSPTCARVVADPVIEARRRCLRHDARLHARAERRVIARAADAGRGAAVPERAAVQHRTAARSGDAAILPRRRRSTTRRNCLEAAISAAVILEQHGYPPLRHEPRVDRRARPRDLRLSGRAADGDRSRGRATPGCTAAGRSSARCAIWRSRYFEPYIDDTGCLKAYGAVDLRVLGRYDWRLSPRKRVEGRAAALRDPAPARSARRRRGSRGCAGATSRSSAPSRPEAGRLLRSADVDASAAGLQMRQWGNGAMRQWGNSSLIASLPHCRIAPLLSQSRSKSRSGFVIGSSLACLSASSKRRESASPRVFSDCTA